jgi:tRNA threonylcarbamoyladenosine biosynthesis protein TsaB
MNVLALETSTEYCSVALWCDGVLTQQGEHAGQRHSQLLLPQCRSVLATAKLELGDLDAIAFSSGPGSFTGLRIACAVAQGLAFGLDVPVVGISSLLALAAATPAERVLACLDARMGEVYYACYQRDLQGWHEMSSPRVCRAEAVSLPDEGSWMGCGNGFVAYENELVAHLNKHLLGIESGVFPQAKEIAGLAAQEFAAGRGIAPELAVPLYVRDRVALKICER